MSSPQQVPQFCLAHAPSGLWYMSCHLQVHSGVGWLDWPDSISQQLQFPLTAATTSSPMEAIWELCQQGPRSRLSVQPQPRRRPTPHEGFGFPAAPNVDSLAPATMNGGSSWAEVAAGQWEKLVPGGGPFSLQLSGAHSGAALWGGATGQPQNWL